MWEYVKSEARIHRVGRRQAIGAIAMTLGGMTTSATTATAEPVEEISHSAEAIHQESVFKASRKRVYEALTDTKQFDRVIELSGAKKSMALGSEPTQVSGEVGGAFVLFGGHIVGRQIELVPNARIVQAWRVVDWEPGIYSIVRFELVEDAGGTRIVFYHTGFPKGQGAHLAAGWKAHYWEPLTKLLT